MKRDASETEGAVERTFKRPRNVATESNEIEPVRASTPSASDDDLDTFDEVDDRILERLAHDELGDTRSALLLLLKEFSQTVSPRQAKCPFASVSQIYGIVGHRTKVDREIDELEDQGYLCVMRLATSEDRAVTLREYFICHVVDVLHKQDVSNRVDDTDRASVQESRESLTEKMTGLMDVWRGARVHDEASDAFDATKNLTNRLFAAGFLRETLDSAVPLLERLTSPLSRQFFVALKAGRKEFARKLKVRFHEKLFPSTYGDVSSCAPPISSRIARRFRRK